MSSNISLDKIDNVCATIVNELGSVGLYHINKITFLFEYFYIKNFATRYTGEKFIKIPHGPVIANYKKRIEKLVKSGILKADLHDLNKSKSLDDKNKKVPIEKGKDISKALIQNKLIFSLILKIIDKYAHLQVEDLEKIVYKTTPMLNFKKSPFKKSNGSYVLSGDCIRMKDYLSAKTKGRVAAQKHLDKYNYVIYDQEKLYQKEFEYLSQLRP